MRSHKPISKAVPSPKEVAECHSEIASLCKPVVLLVPLLAVKSVDHQTYEVVHVDLEALGASEYDIIPKTRQHAVIVAGILDEWLAF